MSKVFEALRQAERGETPDRGLAASPTSRESFLGFQEQHRPFERALQPGLMSPRLVAARDPHSFSAEKFRVLSTQLKHLQARTPLKKLLIGSSVTDEGKTVIAANLAVTLAAMEQKVVLLAGDMRCPTLNQVLGLDHPEGLAEYLEGTKPLDNFVYRLEILKLWYLPVGNAPYQGLQLLQSGRIAKLLAQLTEWFDWVIIDSPPLLPLADASMWARMSDGTLLVVRDGRTPKKLLQKAIERLAEATLLGVVLNDCAANQDNYFKKYCLQEAAGHNQ